MAGISTIHTQDWTHDSCVGRPGFFHAEGAGIGYKFNDYERLQSYQVLEKGSEAARICDSLDAMDCRLPGFSNCGLLRWYLFYLYFSEKLGDENKKQRKHERKFINRYSQKLYSKELPNKSLGEVDKFTCTDLKICYH